MYLLLVYITQIIYYPFLMLLSIFSLFHCFCRRHNIFFLLIPVNDISHNHLVITMAEGLLSTSLHAKLSYLNKTNCDHWPGKTSTWIPVLFIIYDHCKPQLLRSCFYTMSVFNRCSVIPCSSQGIVQISQNEWLWQIVKSEMYVYLASIILNGIFGGKVSCNHSNNLKGRLYNAHVHQST